MSGVSITRTLNFDDVTKDDAVINFCSGEFLDNLDKITERTKRVAWANCMTWLFDKERMAAAENKISVFLYQRDQVRIKHKAELEKLGCTSEFITFAPYFDSSLIDFKVTDDEFTNIGRISRQDSDKFSKNIVHIYEYIVSPRMKRGFFLGFDERSEKKTGPLPAWISGFVDQNSLPVKDFYDTVNFIVQPTDTTENLPRIGFEAMYSGKPLVVDNRGGWKTMIEHGVSGFLCNHERDFIYWGSRLAYEPELREAVALSALDRAKNMSSLGVSRQSWQNVFDKLYQ